MHGQATDRIIQIKREFARTYTGGAHIQEVLPESATDVLPDNMIHPDSLHMFARCNPIYQNSFRQEICKTPCMIYEGDINEYWLGSIKHGSSCQPFYPTWMISAAAIASAARGLGCTEIVDIGSGDGRIAFCGALCGMRAFSIEIDESLVSLQRGIADATGVDFGPVCADALETDYSSMNLSRPAFAVGGLPQMGGEMLADGLLSEICTVPAAASPQGAQNAQDNRTVSDHYFEPRRTSPVIILAGEGERSGPAAHKRAGALGGWDRTVAQYGLEVLGITRLPTVWTFDRDDETPYVFAGLPAAGATPNT